jgi:hypothetical protein
MKQVVAKWEIKEKNNNNERSKWNMLEVNGEDCSLSF